MSDPLSEVIALLQPRAVFAKRISGAGRWGVRYPDTATRASAPCSRAAAGWPSTAQPELTLEAGDFVLLPATPALHDVGLRAGDPDAHRSRRDAGAGGRDPPRPPGRRSRRAAPRRLLRLRLARRVAAGVAAARDRPHARRRAPGDARCGSSATRRPSSAPAATSCSRTSSRCCWSRPCGRRRARTPAGPAARAGRRAARAGDPRAARPGRALVDGDAARPRRRALALGVLRALHAHRRRAADGVPARLAHGPGQGPAHAAASSRSRRSPSASGTARRAASARPSAVTSACRRASTRARDSWSTG